MEIMVEFIMFKEGEFPVDEVKTQIDIAKCKINKKGDLIRFGEYKQLSRIETHTIIEYTTGYIETINVEEPIKIMYDMLLPREKQIVECVEKYDLTAKFCVVINLTDNPAILLSCEFINLVSRLHAEIEFDSYVNYDEEGKLISKKTQAI